ncbi:fibronectin type III domain-containing protein [Streptomyces ferrugineus]|uniref:Fibronectin type III domain-containing protein n=1 Tax=Streptomyces ferrugineus TaxID=1413221 RepID=A0A7M2SY12_9ACTN|nr:fibronectin type III domain-containing protein [Streptomyces ferrugineus]
MRGVLTTPTDIDLDWTGTRPGVAGHVLEFATEEAGPYTVLDHLPRQVSTYRHPDLMPHTTFFYRLRAYRGPVTRPVRADLPDGIRFTWTDDSADEDGFLLEMRRKDSGWYEPVAVVDPEVTGTTLRTLPGEKQATFRIRALVLGEQSNVVRLTSGG